MNKRVFSMALALLLCFSLFGCGSSISSSDGPSQTIPNSSGSESSVPDLSSSEPVSAPERPTVRAAALKGPTAMGLAQLMTSDDPSYNWTLAASADEITPKLVQGELDIAAVPANLASVLYNNTEGQVQVLAVNTLGVLYLVESGDSIHSVEDLRGKTIYASGKGATPEYALNYMLSQNGIDPSSDVTIEWKSEHSECAAALASEENAIAMLPQPFVTTAQMKNESIRVALDMTEEWEKLSSSEGQPATLITGVAVVRKEFAEQNRDLVDQFLQSYEQSVNFALTDVEAAAAAIGQLEIVPEPVAKKALPECNITFLAGSEMKDKLSGYLQTLFDQNPKAIGGAMPGEDFYYAG